MSDLGRDAEFQGHWVQPAPRRIFGFIVLALSSVGAALGMVLLFQHQTFEAMAVLVAFTNIALLTFLALSSSSPTKVTLDGSLLKVQRGRETEEFDLAGPIRRITTIGFPNRPNWLVHLETVDGKIVELGPTQVDPDLIHAAIAHYRAPFIPRQRAASDDALGAPSDLTRLDQA